MMTTCRFKDLLDIIIAVNKFYQTANLKPDVKVKLLKLTRKLREEEKIFVKLKDDIVLRLCKRDNKGNPVIRKQIVKGVPLNVYVFEDPNKYNDEIGPVLETEINFTPDMLEISLNDLCATPLNIHDIDVLTEFNIIKEVENNDRTKKIIIPKN